MPPGEAYHDIGLKLRLTAAVLACASRKDLCARFRAVNPATHCDLDRLHKWMQGRALPPFGQTLAILDSPPSVSLGKESPQL